eukprot:GAHX01002839.1.p2 GENE.GAHX01002839.1~~GAHX01002839.1.p2  ORF type:complete len:101 (-),score=11.40 GAHX01002839.1:651-953(-)
MGDLIRREDTSIVEANKTPARLSNVAFTVVVHEQTDNGDNRIMEFIHPNQESFLKYNKIQLRRCMAMEIECHIPLTRTHLISPTIELLLGTLHLTLRRNN